MKISLKNKVRIGFGVGLLFLLLTSAMAYWSASWSVSAFQAVERTEHVLDRLRAIRAAMLDIETGSRGFVISGQERFLEAYELGLKEVFPQMAELRAATTENPEWKESLAHLESLVSRKIANAADAIGSRRKGVSQSATDSLTDQGKEIMDDFRRLIGNMESGERELLSRRSVETRATFRTTMVVVGATTTLATVLTVIATILAGRDFKRRQLAETERDRFFVLTRDLLCFAGFDGYFKKTNPAWQTVLGFSSDELAAKPFIEFVHPDDRLGTISKAEELAEGKEVVKFENRYRTRDGSYCWLSWNARASIPEKMIYATARDVTEQKEADDRIVDLNKALEQRAIQLEDANKELEAFSYSVSHDLRAPLRHVGGFISQLQKSAGTALGEKERRYVKIISDAARQMGELIDDLLVFSRMGRMEMRHARFSLEPIAQEVISTFLLQEQQRNIVWKNGGLPEVLGDPSMLRQVLANLIGNAVKYTRPRECARIEIGYSETPDEFVFHVRDNGVGFEMEYAHKLFGVFQRLHRAEDFEGTGIGLANVRRIISRHGGRTWAEGTVDAGAAFFFTLPKQKENHNESSQENTAG
jgi:PAS domain S-box-containing protein